MSATSAGYLAGVRRTPAPVRDRAQEPLYLDLSPDRDFLFSREATATSLQIAISDSDERANGKAAKKAAAEARTGALGSLVALIPSEALAIYIAGLAWISGFTDLADPERQQALTLVVLAAGLFSAILIARSYYVGAKAVDNSVTGKVLLSWTFFALLLITEASFVIYVLALPDSPFGLQPLWTGLAAILLTPLLLLFASWLTKRPEDDVLTASDESL